MVRVYYDKGTGLIELRVHAFRAEDARKIAPSYVRRFFERVKTEDEKLLMAILRFYFFSRVVSHDDLDKIDATASVG